MGGKPSTSTPADMRLKENQMDFTAQKRRDLADSGDAMPDGSYPIRNKADLARAILAIGRATNPAAVKAWIIKRARALDAVSLLPSSWGIKS